MPQSCIYFPCVMLTPANEEVYCILNNCGAASWVVSFAAVFLYVTQRLPTEKHLGGALRDIPKKTAAKVTTSGDDSRNCNNRNVNFQYFYSDNSNFFLLKLVCYSITKTILSITLHDNNEIRSLSVVLRVTCLIVSSI